MVQPTAAASAQLSAERCAAHARWIADAGRYCAAGMSKPVNPHAVLGLRSGADEAALQAAYKAQSLKCHPDAPGGSDEAFTLVAAAYDECMRRLHEERWGTSSGAIGSGIKAPLKQITWEPRR